MDRPGRLKRIVTRIHDGIGVVVPIENIMRTLLPMCEAAFQAEREKRENFPQEDNAADGVSYTRDGYMLDLPKVTRPVEQPGQEA